MAPPNFREMMFSDFTRLRPLARPTWLRVAVLMPFCPGLLASLFLRGQQCLVRAGHARLALATRTLCGILTGADVVPGAEVGLGIMMVHPVGMVIGPGSRIGDNVTFAGSGVLGVRNYDYRDPEADSEEYPTIGDGVFIGAHAVVLGGVRVGDHAVVGANSVVRSDVAENSIVSGIPAKHVGYRPEPGDAAVAAS
jgi:serine O-acetyltransferase